MKTLSRITLIIFFVVAFVAVAMYFVADEYYIACSMCALIALCVNLYAEVRMAEEESGE
jgi:Na+/proline symporter